ncbi:toxin VasX [Vreelandella sp. EE7]
MSNDITAANRVADNQPDNDPGDESGQCTLTKEDIQLVPVRYAMVEEPEAERAEAVQGFAPVYGGSFRRSGIRPIRSGWLYIVHSVAPEQLQKFKVEPDGSGDEILLERRGSIQVLHSTLELTEPHASMLLVPEFRRQVMISVGISGYCHGTAHLLDPADLPTALADDLGEYQPTPEAPDYDESQPQVEPEPGSYPWCDEAELTPWQAASAGEIIGSIKSSYQQDSAILIVEDIPARVKDWAQLWRALSEQQEAWQGKYQAENFSAKAIESMMTLDFDNYVANAGQGNIPGWLKNAEQDEQTDLLELAGLCERYRETKNEAIKKEGSFGGSKTRESEDIDREIDELSEELAGKLKTDADSVREFVEKREREHFREVIGGNGLLAPHGIVDVIRQQEMGLYLEYANFLTDFWQTAYSLIGQDLANLASTWHHYRLLLDREVTEHIVLSSVIEKCFFDTLIFCGQEEFLTEYYAGDELNASHLAHYVPEEYFLRNFLPLVNGPQKALNQINALMSVKGALSNFEEWKNKIKEQVGLRFRSIKGLDEEAAAGVASEMHYKEKLFGREVVKGLVKNTTELDVHGRLDNLLGSQNLPGGLRGLLSDILGKLELGIELPDQAHIDKLSYWINTVENAKEHYAAYRGRVPDFEPVLPILKDMRDRSIHSASPDNYPWQGVDQYYAASLRRASAIVLEQERIIKEGIENIRLLSFPVQPKKTGFVRATGLTARATRAAAEEINANARLASASQEGVMSETRLLIRDEQGNISPSSAFSLALNSSLSVLGGVLFVVAVVDMLKETGDDRFVENFSNVLSLSLGTMSSALAINEMLVDARHRKLFEGRSFLQVADNPLKAAAGSPEQLERWARAANKAMAWTNLAGGTAALLETIRQFMKLGRVSTEPERIANQVALFGSSGTSVGMLTQGIRAYVFSRSMSGSQVAKRLLLLRTGVWINWMVAACTVLYIVGDVLASHFSLSKLQSWCQRSYWGSKAEYQSLEEHQLELEKLNDNKANVEVQGVARKYSLGLEGPLMHDLAFRLTLPGGQAPDSSNLWLGLWGMYSGDGTPEDLTQDVLTYALPQADENGIQKIIYHFPPDRVEGLFFVRLVVRTALYADVSGPGEEVASTQVYELYKRGDEVPRDWEKINQLDDGFFSTRKPGTWPDMPLTPWTSPFNHEEAW